MIMTHSQLIVEPIKRFLQILTKHYPGRPISYEFFCGHFPFSCPVSAFNLACQAFANAHTYLAVPETNEPSSGLVLQPSDFLSPFLAGMNHLIQSAVAYYNNNIQNKKKNKSNSKTSISNNNSNNASEIEQPNLSTRTGITQTLCALLKDLGIEAPYPRWLQHFLAVLPPERLATNLKAVREHRAKKRGFYNALGAVRNAFRDNWQPSAPSQAPKDFLTWFDEMRRRNLVLGSRQTGEGLMVYGCDGEPLGVWPEVAALFDSS